jgi:hypothetical protein
MPPIRLLRVACAAKPIAPSTTVDETVMAVRFTPSASIRNSAYTATERNMLTSPRMRGTARRASSTLARKAIQMRKLPSAMISRQISRGITAMAR